MSVEVLMPALSPTMEEGTLAKWLVKVGDQVRSGDIIAEIETDKATMEVEAVDEGVVDALLVAEGAEEVKVNTPIARLRSEGEAAESAPPPPLKVEPPPPVADDASVTQPTAAAEPKPTMIARRQSIADDNDGRVMASPLARRLAAQLGLELSQVSGSGPHGRIVRKDVEAHAPAKDKPTTPQRTVVAEEREAAAPPLHPASLEEMGIAPGTYDLIPLDGMKKTIARRMTASFRDVPHFPLSIEVEIDALLAARVRINALLEKDGVKVSVNDMVIKAAATALMRTPEANASYTPEGIAMHHDADIAVAVAIDGGLITPIIRAAQTKGLSRIAVEMKDLAERARTRKLKPEEFQGGTFSISNLGMFGVTSFASIINQPQGAILSVGAGQRRPVVRGETLGVATVMNLTLTCDHRVVDGAIGARWLAAFKTMIEDPIAMIV